MKLDNGMQRKLFVRSWLLQTAWDYRHMQGLGFALGLSPILRRLYPHAEDRRKALRRHLDFFNTQPYMVGFALGVSAHQEEELAREPSAVREERIVQTKRSLGSALAAIGDPLFWGGWRPLCAALIAIPLLFTRPVHPCVGIVTGGVILYNIPVWTWRWKSIRWGFEDGERVVSRLSRMRIQRWLRRIRWAGFIWVALSVLPVFLFGFPVPATPPTQRFIAMPLGALVVCWLMKRMGWSGMTAYAALWLLGIGAAFVSWIIS